MSVRPYHTVTLQFSDGEQRAVTVPDGKTVLDAAIEAQIPILHQCRSGSCSSCMAVLLEGQASVRPGASSTLSRSEVDAGHRLLCVTEVQTDCKLALNYRTDAGEVRPVRAHAFIDSIERLAPNVVRLTMELADGAWMNFKPGQFLQVTVPGVGVARSYSPASTPADLPRIVLLIRLLPEGAMSDYLRDRAKPDDVIEIEGPFGNFFLRESRPVPHIMVAGGTGLAPVMSMIDALRVSSGRRQPILLSFGCATPDALFYLNEIALRKQWLPSLSARVSVDRDARAELLLGSPVDALCPSDITDPGTVAYLCGPPPMIEAASIRLRALGIQPDNIFSEQFTATNP